MEDYFDKSLYLIVGIVYFILENVMGSNTKEQPLADKPAELQTSPAAVTDGESAWRDDAQCISQYLLRLVRKLYFFLGIATF